MRLRGPVLSDDRTTKSHIFVTIPKPIYTLPCYKSFTSKKVKNMKESLFEIIHILGNLTAIELRRCQNASIVGAAAVTGGSGQGSGSGNGGPSAARKNTSRASSGIGSDPLSENDERFSLEQCSSGRKRFIEFLF